MAKWIKFKLLDQEKRITKRWQVLAIQGLSLIHISKQVVEKDQKFKEVEVDMQG